MKTAAVAFLAVLVVGLLCAATAIRSWTVQVQSASSTADAANIRPVRLSTTAGLSSCCFAEQTDGGKAPSAYLGGATVTTATGTRICPTCQLDGLCYDVSASAGYAVVAAREDGGTVLHCTEVK